MSDYDRIKDLLPAYVMGSLDNEEKALVEEYLAACRACRVEIDALTSITDQLGLAVPEAAPPAHLRRRLLAQIQPAAKPTAVPPSRPALSDQLRRWFQHPVWRPAVALLVIILIVGSVFLWQRLNASRIGTIPDGMIALPVTGVKAHADANGFILVSQDGLSGAIVVDELPMLGEEQIYQLWLWRDGTYESAARFSVEETGYGASRVWPSVSLYDYARMKVTIEPAGGSEQPTSPALLTGELFDR